MTEQFIEHGFSEAEIGRVIRARVYSEVDVNGAVNAHTLTWTNRGDLDTLNEAGFGPAVFDAINRQRHLWKILRVGGPR